MSEFLTINKSIERLQQRGIQISKSTIHKLLLKGKMCEHTKFAGKILFPVDKFDAWTNEHFGKKLLGGNNG